MGLSIFNYSSSLAMKDLCEYLGFQKEVTDRLINHIEKMDLKRFDPYFKGLFSLETGEESTKEISALCKTKEDPSGDNGLKALSIYLAAAQHTYEIYKGLGISRQVYLDSMEAFNLFVNEHMQSYGYYGFDRDHWIYRQLSAKIFRLGELEYELLTLSENSLPIGKALGGSPVLSVHIPSSSLLTRDALDTSYGMAKEFFFKHFPDYNYMCVYCATWLLSPVLKQFLKEGSHILEFQSDYEIVHVNKETNNGLKWIYKKEYDDFTQLPEDTSLMRNIKKHLLAGGKIGAATGYVRDFDKR